MNILHKNNLSENKLFTFTWGIFSVSGMKNGVTTMYCTYTGRSISPTPVGVLQLHQRYSIGVITHVDYEASFNNQKWIDIEICLVVMLCSTTVHQTTIHTVMSIIIYTDWIICLKKDVV